MIAMDSSPAAHEVREAIPLGVAFGNSGGIRMTSFGVPETASRYGRYAPYLPPLQLVRAESYFDGQNTSNTKKAELSSY